MKRLMNNDMALQDNNTKTFQYGFGKNAKIVMFFLSISVIAFFIMFLYLSDEKGIWLGIWGILGILIFNFLVFGLQIELTQNEVIGRLNLFGKKLVKKHILKNIKIVNEDSFWFLHGFHLKGENKREHFILTNFINNYRQLLSEIVLRVNPKTYVDDKTLEYANLNREDIGKLYKSENIK